MLFHLWNFESFLRRSSCFFRMLLKNQFFYPERNQWRLKCRVDRKLRRVQLDRFGVYRRRWWTRLQAEWVMHVIIGVRRIRNRTRTMHRQVHSQVHTRVVGILLRKWLGQIKTFWISIHQSWWFLGKRNRKSKWESLKLIEICDLICCSWVRVLM